MSQNSTRQFRLEQECFVENEAESVPHELGVRGPSPYAAVIIEDQGVS